MSKLKHDFTVWCRLLSRCASATFGTVRTIWKHCSCFFNFRDSVSSINQLLNQMCEDGYPEEVRPVNLLLLSYWHFTACSDSRQAAWCEHTADYMLQYVGTGKRENDTVNPQNPGIFSRHVIQATTVYIRWAAKTRRRDHSSDDEVMSGTVLSCTII